MSKITKKQLQQSVDLLDKENSSQHDYLMRINRALKSIDIDILSAKFDEPKPQLKQLDQSIFNGLDEKWRFAAIDGERGIVTVFDLRPIPSSCNNYHTNTGEGNYKDLYELTGYDTSNWQDSLIERSTAKELTGSELCKAMLERGDKYVMCLVFDDTRNLDVTYVIREYHNGYFHTKRNSWENAVPINNQGEPLTAEEVGL